MKTFAAAAASLLLALPAMALPNLSVTYRDPSLTVSPTDDIEIWVHVESSTPIDSSLGAPFGFAATDLPKTATLFGSNTPVAFASYTGLSVLPGTSCIPTCDIAGYELLSWFPGNTKPLFSNLSGSRVVNGDYLAAIYRPKADQPPSGSFTVPLIPSLSFNVFGVSAAGTALNAYLGPVNGFAACSYSKLDSCGVKVTVQAVPEPSAWALMALGMTALVATRRRFTA
jgi:hypothetical protein